MIEEVAFCQVCNTNACICSEIPTMRSLLCGQRAYLVLMNEGIRKAKMHFTSEDIKTFEGCRANFSKELRPDVVLLIDNKNNTLLKRWEGVR